MRYANDHDIACKLIKGEINTKCSQLFQKNEQNKNKLLLNGLIKRKNSRHEFQSLPCDAFGSRTGLIVVGGRVEKAEPS